MRIACIIPARGGSKGIPGKNVMDFCGKPLIVWSIRQALRCDFIDNVYVTTDDKKIASVSEKAGAYVIDRPPELATDIISIEPVIEHALSIIDPVEVIVHLQATSPIRTSLDISNAINVYKNEGKDIVFSACKLEDYCIWSKDSDNSLNSITFNYKNRGRRQDRPSTFLENGSIYVFGSGNIKKFGQRFGGKIGMSLMPFWQSYEIDNPEDIEICEYYMKKLMTRDQKTYEQ